MSTNNQNYEARGVSLTPAQWDRCDRLTEEYGKKSRNSFIREAVDFYCAWLEKEHTQATDGGVDPKTLAGILGHTDASFTLDTYTHVTSDMQKGASAIVNNMMQQFLITEETDGK